MGANRQALLGRSLALPFFFIQFHELTNPGIDQGS
jgi:hypothetical protein